MLWLFDNIGGGPIPSHGVPQSTKPTVREDFGHFQNMRLLLTT